MREGKKNTTPLESTESAKDPSALSPVIAKDRVRATIPPSGTFYALLPEPLQPPIPGLPSQENPLLVTLSRGKKEKKREKEGRKSFCLGRLFGPEVVWEEGLQTGNEEKRRPPFRIPWTAPARPTSYFRIHWMSIKKKREKDGI